MSDERAPILRVVRGDPTPDELAALVAVVASRLGDAVPAERRPTRSAWSDLADAMTPIPRPGPDAWRRSARLPGARTTAGR